MCYSALERLPESTAPPQQQEADPDKQLVLGEVSINSDIHSEFTLLHVNQMAQHSASCLDILY